MEFLHEIFSSKFFIPFTVPFNSVQRVWIPYLLTSYVFAFVLTALEMRRERTNMDKEERPSLLKRVFPKEVYLHRSAIVDYFYFYSNTLLYAVLTAPSIFSLSKVSFQTFHFLENTFGSIATEGPVSYSMRLLYALALILAIDLGLFLAHWIQHVVPLLWNFHKVHHSAEVLTPISVYRMHPLDDMLNFLASGTLAGIVEGVFRYSVSFNISPVFVGRLNVFLFLFYIAFYHLRHSHIWCSYGPFWSKIFISPSQHQIHHSTAPRHWNKNYGFIFAFWDGALGSLYVPREKEEIEFGIGDGSEKSYSNFLLLYLLPFRDSFRMLRRRLFRHGTDIDKTNSEVKTEGLPKSD